MKLSDQLIQLSARIMLATKTEERLILSSELAEIAKQTISLSEPEEQATATGFLKFTQKEISKMPKTFKKEFIAQGAVAHIRKRPSGKHTFYYEIRYRRSGYNISVSSTDIEIAKEKFIAALNEPNTAQSKQKELILFETIAEEWFRCRIDYISEQTHKAYSSYYKRYILPFLNGKDITKIRSAELTPIMKQVKDKGRAYEDVRSILKQIFEYAKNNGIIAHSPVNLIEFIKANRKSGQALSVPEEHILLDRLNDSYFKEYKTAFQIMLFFGLRPCELSTIRLDGDFIISRNAKRKKGKIEYKRIPFTAIAKKYLTAKDIYPITHKVKRLNDVFQKIFPDKKQYYLRHTFATRCQQFVRREIVEVWLGDSAERLIGNTYTHFPDDFMKEEAEKVDYTI